MPKQPCDNRYLIVLLPICFLSLSIFLLPCNCKIFTPCELGAFFLTQDIPYEKIGDWVCVAHASSRYNSSYLTGMYNNPWNNLQYGIFQITNRWFCVDKWKPNANDCHLNCSQLLDENLVDDLKCARLLHRRGNYTFSNFWAFKSSCSNESSVNNEKYIGHCDFANGTAPEILNNDTNIQLYLDKIKPGVEALSCDINGTLPINITWTKNFNILENTDPLYKVETQDFINDSLVSSKLYFKQSLTKSLPSDLKLTQWKCTGKNMYGDASKSFYVRIFDPLLPPDTKTDLTKQIILTIISSIITAVLIISISVAVYKFWLRKRIQFTKEEIKEFEEGTSVPTGETNYAFMYERFRSDPYNKDLEISINDLRIHGNKRLGSGEFGEVYLGEFKGIKIAVKTSQKARISGNSKEYIQSLLTEIKVLSWVKGHQNIIELIGAYTKELRTGKVFVLTEFCPYGSLESQLKSYRTNKGNSYRTVGEQIESPVSKHQYANQCIEFELNSHTQLEPIEINHQVMLNWATQIASGMEWLGSNNVVHGDLATRNVLLQSPETVKITDFGLSIKLYNYRMKQVKNTKMPWRWMSIETLRELILSPQGDVWSFGICLWEIFSFAQVPYPGVLTYNLEILDQLENETLRNPQPPDTPKAIYDIMLDCWKTNPTQRPSFQLLRERLFLESRKFSAPTVYVDFREFSQIPCQPKES